MDEKRSRTSPVPDPFFYSNNLIPRHPHTPDEFTLEIKVDIERLTMEIIPSQPAPQPQCEPSSRRAAVDMGSEESGTLRRSPAIGQMDPEYRGLKYQRRRKDLSLLKTVWMVFCI